MNIKTAFPSNYIAAEDMQGQDVPVQIADCRMEAVKQDNGPDKDKPVLYFAGHQRGLVLNVTNALAIATLYPTQCPFGNRMVDCIRVRPFSPQTPLGAAPSMPPREFATPAAAPAATHVPAAMATTPATPPVPASPPGNTPPASPVQF